MEGIIASEPEPASARLGEARETADEPGATDTGVVEEKEAEIAVAEDHTGVEHDTATRGVVRFGDAVSVDLEIDDQAVDPEWTGSVYHSRRPSPSAHVALDRPYDTTTLNSSSRSLYAEDLEYVFENGRRYCKDYPWPNDIPEQDRLRVVHQVYLHVFDMELSTVPLANPSHILDVGTGTGEWAIGMAEIYPDCEVVGLDISALAPTAVPHNCFFEVDDCEIEWMRPENSLDLVHMRDMSGAIMDWSFIYQQAFTCLKPGGYIEVLDFEDFQGAQDFYGHFPPESEIHLIAQQVEEGTKLIGRRRGTGHMEPRLLTEVGFVDVEVKQYSLPLSPIDNALGKLWLIAGLHSVEAGALRILTKHMGWDPSEALAALDRVCQEFQALALNPATGKDFNVSLKLVTARKPPYPGFMSAQSVTENGQMPEYVSGDDSTIGG